MSCDCCTSSNKPSHEASCPACRHPGEAVSRTTLLHQLRSPWQQPPIDGQYYFCNQSGCEVVYFNMNGGHFTTDAVRLPVGQKSTDTQRTLCYCFDIRFSDLADSASAKRCHDFVIDETRNKVCSCEERNPSGRCCLRDFPKEKE